MRCPATAQPSVSPASTAALRANRARLANAALMTTTAAVAGSPSVVSAASQLLGSGVLPKPLSTRIFMGHGCRAASAEPAAVSTKMMVRARHCGTAYFRSRQYLDLMLEWSMNPTICLAAETISYLHGGGHFWVHLNWALGFRSIGCEVVWLEPLRAHWSAEQVRHDSTVLADRLASYGISLALWGGNHADADTRCRTLEDAASADLLFNMYYGLPASVISRFRRSALLDIDPGLLQTSIEI